MLSHLLRAWSTRTPRRRPQRRPSRPRLEALECRLPPSTAEVTNLVDSAAAEPQGPAFQFDKAAYSTGEASSAATITVTRTAPLGAAASVEYAVTAGTATAGSDFT